jgi:hypothetical protein|tara:strand:+ start:3782 stop:4048 length:267 start_codon:yes stop_codon:yes gene_type:complete
MKAKIHINQHVIRRNGKTGEREPVITVKTYKSNEYASEVLIDGPSRLVYSPDKPLSCGAKVWIEADYDDLRLSVADEKFVAKNSCGRD